jgi:hypothetical protein
MEKKPTVKMISPNGVIITIHNASGFAINAFFKLLYALVIEEPKKERTQ